MASSACVPLAPRGGLIEWLYADAAGATLGFCAEAKAHQPPRSADFHHALVLAPNLDMGDSYYHPE